MSTDRVRDRIRVLVNQPGEGMAQWMRGLGMTVEPWGDPSVAVSGNPDVVRMMLYTRADSVVVPPGAALVGEKVNIKPLDLDPRVAERLDAVTALSPAARAMLAGTRWADAPIVPYGVPQSPMMVGQREAWRAELRADLGIADTATVAIWCGRMQAVEKYLAALREAIEATPEVHWLVIGYFQSGFERYRDDWLRWSVGRPITWIEDAYPDRAARLCYAGDFAVSTSSSEGLSLAVVDAVAAGLPVVASDSGGVRHAVISGITGYLTPHEDTARLVAAVQRMAEMEPTVRRDMGVVFGQQLAAARFDGREYARACRVVDLEAALGRRPYAVEPVPPSDAGEDAPAAEPCEPPDPPASAAELEGRRIAWFFDRPVTGGLLWRAAVLAAVLRKAGVQTSLAFGRRAQNDILDWARDHGVEVTARPEEVDLLHVGWPPIPPAWCDAPMVTWVAGSAVRPLLERPEAARWARLVMVHESMSAHVPEALADRAVTIHNAVPPEWYQPAGETEPAILCVGRWNDPVKRLPDVCQAVEAMPDARFILVGAVRDGYVPAALREALSTGRVRWLPRVSPMQMPAIYRQATIYWQPSLDEGYPVAALEAQAAGLALVLTDTGGSREVVGACNGYLVPDFRTGLQRLRELWAKPALARALGENSRGAATAGGRWEAYLHGYLALYQSLLEE